MICQIIENGGYMFLILIQCMVVINSIKEDTLRVREFCLGNKLIHNIEPGEPYVLTLKSDSSADINKLYHRLHKTKCRQEFKTSDSAGHFEIYITNMNIPSCLNISCRCNYFEISEFEHSKRFCGNKEDSFKSKSDSLFIHFNPEYEKPFEVTLTFQVQRNFYIITGAPKNANVPSNIIETPYFPKPYSPNYRAEYVIQSDVLDLHVMLLFLDFLVSYQSFIEVTGDNGTTTRFYGTVTRPPVVVSHSNELSLKFKSSDQHDMPGFSAEVWFIKSNDPLFVPYTDCGGIKDESSGFMYIKTQKEFRLYDCIWYIMPFISTTSNMSVFSHLRHISPKSYLEFRQGRYSKSGIIEIIDCEYKNCTILDREIVVPASDSPALYIRFKGYLDEHSVVNMSYNAYRIGSCTSNEFQCNDGRCLKASFRCDNIKQCPDGIDEDNCHTLNVPDEKVFLHPTAQDYYDTTHTKFVWILIIGILGILTVLSVVFILFYYCCKQATTHSNQLLPQRTARDELSAVHPILLCPGNSCGYDIPPSYEDFMKSSDTFPPPLYSRANQRFVPNINRTHHTTSFCTGARVRHYSADSYDVRCSDSGSDIFLNVGRENLSGISPASSTRCNIEINHNITFKTSKNMKRACSLDSKLNDLNKDSCNVCLSIIHPVCAHPPNNSHRAQWFTLPANFKINTFKSSYNGLHVNRPVSSNSFVNSSKGRRFTWSFVPEGGSEVVTIVKTRCFSDPHKGISVHCSLY